MAKSRLQNFLGGCPRPLTWVKDTLPFGWPRSSSLDCKRCFEAIFTCISFLLICGAFLETAVAQSDGPSSGNDDAFAQCRLIKMDAARLHCYENAASSLSASRTDQGTNVAGAWRLVRSRGAAGGREAISIMHTAELSKSDVDFAGLMLRCGDKGAVEVLVVLVETFPPSSNPKITTVAGQDRAEFTGTVVPPGALVLLPPEAAVLAQGHWQAAPELSVTLEEGKTLLRGSIPLEGLGAALLALRSSCPMR